ncbi:MAG: Rdx family protein [Calditrichales bacterium]|nr:Rdx family protein [Calditrichales bacterium]
MAEEIKQEFDFEIEFKKSHGGRFEIVLNDELLFSKASLNRFPEDGEIVRIIKEKLKN